MTDGTSQGLFIVVAIVIFGIFTVMAYILFEDTLSPALASMFTDTNETASKRLNKNVKLVGSWDYEMDASRNPDGKQPSHYEFMHYGVDMSPIFEEHGIGKYIFKFDAKSTNEGPVRMYSQNSSSARYGWDWLTGEYHSTEIYKQYSLNIDVRLSNLNEQESLLAFIGMNYDTERFPTVKNVRIYKVLE